MSGLELGQTFKNYKELACYLGEDIKGGKAKQLQLKNWDRYFTYEKQGNKFIITGIYDEPLPPENTHGGARNNKYTEFIDPLILDMLNRAEDNHVSITCKTMFTENDYISILSDLWGDIRFTGHESVAKEYDISAYSVQQYCQKVNSVLTNTVKSSLNRLQKQGYISWSKEYYVLSNKEKGGLLAKDYDADLPDKIKEIEDTYFTESGMERRDLYNNDNYEIYMEYMISEVSDCTNEDVWNYWNVYDIQLQKSNDTVIDDKALKDGLTRKLVESINESLLKKTTKDKETGEDFHIWRKYKLNNFMIKMNYRLFADYEDALLKADDMTDDEEMIFFDLMSKDYKELY